MVKNQRPQEWKRGDFTISTDAAGLRRWLLVTRDAHGLYRKVGFRELTHPERVMEMVFPGIYERRK